MNVLIPTQLKNGTSYWLLRFRAMITSDPPIAMKTNKQSQDVRFLLK